MRLVNRMLPAALVLLAATGCVAKSVPSDPSGPASPSDSQPPVITESALPTDDSSATDPNATGTDTEQPSDLVRPSSTAPVGLANCALPYLRVSVRAAATRSAHASYLLTFTNTGQIACQLTGYPAVVVLSSAGRPVLRATATPSGYLGGVRGKPATVLVAAGQPASALLEGEQIDLGGNRCPARPGLQITPPGSTVPARVPVTTTICGGVQIHPVVGGNTGSSR